MSDIAIRVEGIGKRYRIGAREHQNAHRAWHEWMTTPFDYLRTALREPSPDEILWALKDVSFEVKQGEVVGVIGRNGSGKSTLLKILSRITEPTEGYADIYGRVGSLLEVGTGFHPDLTGRENIYLSGTILGMKKVEIDRKFDEIVAFAEIEKFIDTPVKRFSSGMYVRLAFAVAAHLEPEILLVDEVLAVGDAAFQKKCLGKMGDVAKEGRTVLFVSHNMLAIENICPRSIWINNGNIREDGRTRSILHDYLSSSVKQNGGLDLRDAERFRGTGEIKYIQAEFLDTQKRPVDVVRSGDSIVLRLHYDAKTVVAHPHFIVGISNELGIMVTQMATFLIGYQLPVLQPGVGYIDLEISFLNLMPGRYYASLNIQDEKLTNYYDDIGNCIVLDMQPSDFYQSGQGIEERYGIIFLPCKWSAGYSEINSKLREPRVL